MGPLRLLILQATPYCNLDCTYCYLPDKTIRKRLPMNVIESAVANIHKAGIIKDEFSVVWHAGEPLAAGIKFYREADAIIRKQLPPNIKFKHCLQTNGTLINQEWCDLFKELNIHVGVSIDGPAFINDLYRIDRSGKGSLLRILNGIKYLQDNDISFHTISVLTKEAVKVPEDIFWFLHSLNPESIAFNVEEIEGVHESSSLTSVTEEEFGAFIERIYELSFLIDNPNFVREIRNAHVAVMASVRKVPKVLPMESNPLAIINVDIDGNFSSFSPELLGMKHPAHGDFIFGNFLKSGLEHLDETPKFKEISQLIMQGVQKCHASCEYFHFCGGGAPSNKLFENGTFDSSETMHCRMTKKVVTDIVLSRMENMISTDMPEEYAELLA